jgi:exodeoxyribonuclease-3
VIYTFWDYFRNAYGRNAGLRIDHILLSPALTPALKSAGVDRDVRGRDKPSDHAPVWVELDLGSADGTEMAAATLAGPARPKRRQRRARRGGSRQKVADRPG